MQRKPVLSLVAVLAAVAGCAEPIVPAAGRYAWVEQQARVDLEFEGGTTALTSAGQRKLQEARPALSQSGTLVLITDPAMAMGRAEQVSKTLGLAVLAQPGMALRGHVGAATLIWATNRLVPDTCTQPSRLGARDNWPEDDGKRATFLPLGCASASAIQQMASQPTDLSQGRDLAPAAALPVARAAEIYLNGGRAPGGSSSSPASNDATKQNTNPSSTPSITPSEESESKLSPTANPLLGPL